MQNLISVRYIMFTEQHATDLYICSVKYTTNNPPDLQNIRQLRLDSNSVYTI
jgi:hypothetical protein